MGIRNTELFNKALLYKYAWRCHHKKDSLLSRIYRVKYSRTTMEAALSGEDKPHWSWGYKGIVRVAKELKNGIAWKLGSGRMINTKK